VAAYPSPRRYHQALIFSTADKRRYGAKRLNSLTTKCTIVILFVITLQAFVAAGMPQHDPTAATQHALTQPAGTAA